MRVESGLIGHIEYENRRVAVDRWEIDHDSRSAKAYCNTELFVGEIGIPRDLPAMVQELTCAEWRVRFDNETHLYYGFARCTAMTAVRLRCQPMHESISSDLVLYFDFVHPSYGPMSIHEGKRLARNGNDFFFDLLTSEELAIRVCASGDPRFIMAQKWDRMR